MYDHKRGDRGYTADFLVRMMQRVRDENPDLDERALAEVMVEAYVQELPSALEEEASKLVDAILEGTVLDLSVKEYEQLDAGFRERLRARWGHAFGLHRVFTMAVASFLAELGKRRDQEPEDDLEERAPAVVIDVVLGLLAKAVLTSHEVLRLLSGGFPFGALAHARTLHELAVVACLICQKDGGETARRYVAHRVVAAYHEAIDYQAACDMTGWEPLTPEELKDIKAARDEAVGEHGAHFGTQYGWAAHLTAPNRPTFDQLAAAADVSHWRIAYRESSHRVHAGIRGLELNILTRGHRAASLIGPTNVQLEVAGQETASGLMLVAAQAMIAMQSLPNLLMGRALLLLSQRVADAYEEAAEELHADEEALQETVRRVKRAVANSPGIDAADLPDLLDVEPWLVEEALDYLAEDGGVIRRHSLFPDDGL